MKQYAVCVPILTVAALMSLVYYFALFTEPDEDAASSFSTDQRKLQQSHKICLTKQRRHVPPFGFNTVQVFTPFSFS